MAESGHLPGLANSPWLLASLAADAAFAEDIRSRFPIGGRCALLKPAGSIIMREGEDLNSKEVQKLRASSAGGEPSQLWVLKHGRAADTKRLKARDAAGVSGWVSVISNSGQELLHPRTAWLSLASMDGGDVEAAQHALSELRRAHLAAQQHGGDLAAELLCAHAASAERLARLQLAEEEAREQVQESSKLHQETDELQADLHSAAAEAEAMKAKIAGLEDRVAAAGQLREEMRSAQREVDVLRLRLEDAQQGQNLHRGEARRAHEEVEVLRQGQLSQDLQQRRVLTMTEQMEEETAVAARATAAMAAAQQRLRFFEEEQEHRALQSTAEVASAQEDARAESAALLRCEAKLESLERREETRKLFENVQVEFQRKEEQTKQELREAVLLRSEASQAADEALALRAKLSREDEDLTGRQAAAAAADLQATQKLETAMVELDRARQLTQELNRDKAEAAKELAEAATAAARAGEEKRLAQQQSLEAEMAANEALKACEDAEEDRRKVKEALLLVSEDLESASRQYRQSRDYTARSEATQQQVLSLEAEVARLNYETQRLSKALTTEESACSEYRVDKERVQRELHDLSRLTRWSTPRLRGAP